MKPTSIIQRLVILLITLMSAIGANAQEAYACYTSSNTTLTFYYDNLRSSRTGTTYSLNKDVMTPGWESDQTNRSVTQVVFDSSFANARPTTTYMWFYNMYSLQSITGLNYLNTSKVTSMANMFCGCNLTSLDLSSFNTSKVTDMSSMFENSRLKSLDLSSFNTSKVTNMSSMFEYCLNLRTIYVGSGWNTAAVTVSGYMFYNCHSLEGGQGTTYDESHVDKTYARIDGGTSTPGYFTAAGTEPYACYQNGTLTFYYDNQRDSRTGTTYSLKTEPVSQDWFTDKTNANVTRVVFDSSFAHAHPTNTYGWFSNMKNLQSISNIGHLNTSEVTSMASMFANCQSLTTLDLTHFNTGMVTNMGAMFSGCTNLQTIYVGDGWSTENVTDTYSVLMFSQCTSLVGGQDTTWKATNPSNKTYAHVDGGPNNPGYFTTPPEAYACYTPENTTLTFYYDSKRSSREGRTYDLNTVYNDPVWSVDGAYASATQVVFDSSFASVYPSTTYEWFMNMNNLQSITGMEYLNTSEVTNMAWMFANCTSLTSLDLSSFNTAKVTNMVGMFSSCTSLTSLNLSSFNTSKVTEMFNMFNGCYSLNSLNLSSFNTSNVTNMGQMFYGCEILKTIYVGDGWSTDKVTESDNMFAICDNLVGGQGTIFDENHVNATYAHIDGGTNNPGYFSEKPNEAYTCYTPENTTLTFYYDNKRSSREGTTYDLNTGDNAPGWYTDNTYIKVTKVEFDPSFADARPTSIYYWFYDMTKLRTILGLTYLNTSKVTEMSWMFYYCCNLTNLDLSSFNTSKVTSMVFMFSGCSNLRTIYVGSSWNTAPVQYSSQMFGGCTLLVGGQGTGYNSSYVDATYAHIDGGPSNPGYFTYKKPSGIATDLHQVTSDKSQVTSDEWYTIDGRKLNGMPAKKGVYIQNGKKTVIH